jgi:hypothetical protein
MGSRHRSFVALLVAVLIPLIYARALLDVRYDALVKLARICIVH